MHVKLDNKTKYWRRMVSMWERDREWAKCEQTPKSGWEWSKHPQKGKKQTKSNFAWDHLAKIFRIYKYYLSIPFQCIQSDNSHKQEIGVQTEKWTKFEEINTRQITSLQQDSLSSKWTVFDVIH